jgi:hypothetical protein
VTDKLRLLAYDKLADFVATQVADLLGVRLTPDEYSEASVYALYDTLSEIAATNQEIAAKGAEAAFNASTAYPPAATGGSLTPQAVTVGRATRATPVEAGGSLTQQIVIVSRVGRELQALGTKLYDLRATALRQLTDLR